MKEIRRDKTRGERFDCCFCRAAAAACCSLSHLLRERPKQTNCKKKKKKKKNRPTLVARASNNDDDEFAHHSHPVSADDLGDWRAFRAALVTSERGAGPPPTVGALSEPARAAARWAHSVSAPEKGCLLLAARPDLGPLFTQAVVLIVDHGEKREREREFFILRGEESAEGGKKEREEVDFFFAHRKTSTPEIFLFEKKKMQNRRRRRLRGPRPQRPLPRPHRRRRARPGACGFLLGTAAVLRRARGAELAAPAPRCEEKRERVFFFLKERRRVFFRRRSAPRGRRKKETHFFPLFFFFFLTKRNKTGAPGLEGAHEVIGGVYAGGLPSANSLVSSGGAAAGAFRLLSGYAGWEPGQLAAEAERGAWHVVAASTAVVLDAVQGKKERVCFPFFFSSLYLFSPRLQRKNPCPRAPFFSLFPSPFFFSFSLSVFFPPTSPLLVLPSPPVSLIEKQTTGRLRDAHGTREKVGTWASIMALAGIGLDGHGGGLGGFDSSPSSSQGSPPPPPSSDKKRRGGRAQGPSAFD